MANAFTLNNSTASLAPYSVLWRNVEIGQDHNGLILYARHKEIDMQFDSGSVSFAREWIERASSGSLNMDVIEQNGLGYKTLSGVILRITNYPDLQSVVSGPFSLTVLKVV